MAVLIHHLWNRELLLLGYMEQDISRLFYAYGLLLDCFPRVILWLVKRYRSAGWLLGEYSGLNL